MSRAQSAIRNPQSAIEGIPSPARANAPALPDDAFAVDLLTGMVEIPSLSGEEHGVAAFLASRMLALGMDAEVDRAGNAVGIVPFTQAPGRPLIDLVMLGHMDTVPGDIPVRREGDLLHGRGSVDAKGPLATFAMAAARAKLPPGVRLIVIGATEEEAASSKGARFAATQYQPAACIIGEPSHWDGVTLGYKGRLLCEYSLTMPCHHSAGPEPSGPELACAWWEGVKRHIAELNETRRTPFELVQAALRTINTESDGLYDRVRAVVGFRLPLGIDPADLERVCRELGKMPQPTVAPFLSDAGLTARPEDGPWHPVIECSGPEVAVATNRNNMLVRAFSGAIRTHGGTPRPRLKTGTSDMNVLGPLWNCPMVAYGPGDSRLDHTPHEHLSISEYLRSINVLVAAIERIAGELAGGTN
jgi:LysW-gamma-L-lysine carboxypeptidase